MQVRRARVEDVPFLVATVTHPEIAPYLAAARPRDATVLAEAVSRMEADPVSSGIFVVDVGGVAAGTVAFERVNRRSRIAELEGLAILPELRSQGVAAAAVRAFVDLLCDELGFHRVQCEVYGFNDRAAAFFERVGFTREGVRRRAYLRGEDWVDGVLFGLLADERR